MAWSELETMDESWLELYMQEKLEGFSLERNKEL